MQPDDVKCIRCTLANVLCDTGQQRKVGRPKRKEPALTSTGEHPAVTKRRKTPTSQNPRRAAVNNSNDRDSFSIQDVPGFPDISESNKQCTEGDVLSHRYASGQPLVSTSIPISPDPEWLGFPTVMTDGWCRNMIPAATRGRVLTHSKLDLSPDSQARQSTTPFPEQTSSSASYDFIPGLLGPVDQALFQESLAWINPDFLINPRSGSRSKYGLMKKPPPPPFGIGRPAAYYVHENKFSSNPLDVVTTNIGVDGSGAMVKLLSIVYGLRLRSALVQSNRSKMNLTLLIHRQGPLFIGSHSLCEYVMDATQELVQIVSILLEDRPRSVFSHDDQLSACLVSTIMDVYCRILSFFELFLEHLTDRAERFTADPILPIPGLTFNGVVLTGSCTQGTLFSSSCFYLLGRLEQVLGLDTVPAKGLLSTSQIDALCTKLDGSDDLVQSRGIMRPSDVKKLYAQMATVLEQLSLAEQ